MCVKLHIDKKLFSFAVFKTHMMMGKHHSKAKRNLITKLTNETHCKYFKIFKKLIIKEVKINLNYIKK